MIQPNDLVQLQKKLKENLAFCKYVQHQTSHYQQNFVNTLSQEQHDDFQTIENTISIFFKQLTTFLNVLHIFEKIETQKLSQEELARAEVKELVLLNVAEKEKIVVNINDYVKEIHTSLSIIDKGMKN